MSQFQFLLLFFVALFQLRMLTLPVIPLPLELNMFCLSQLNSVLGKGMSNEFATMLGRWEIGQRLAGGFHAPLYTRLCPMCPELFLCADGSPKIYIDIRGNSQSDSIFNPIA
jgi:hypothetical protein